MIRNSIQKAFLGGVLMLAATQGANASIVTVLNATNNSAASLRASILAANSGDTIQFSAITNGSAIALTTGEIVIGKSLVIMGNGTTNTVISGNSNSRIFNISNAGTVTIIGVKLTGGATLLNGGAMDISNTTVNIQASEISGNTAVGNGGGINNSGTVNLSNTLDEGNSAAGIAASNGGGAIFNNGGTVNITNGSILRSNLATGLSGSGGAIFTSSGAVTISESTLELNAANRAGGAIEIVNGSLNIGGSFMNRNDVNGTAGTANPGNGGALHVSGATAAVTIDSTTVNSNKAAREGGGLWNQAGSTMTVSNNSIINYNLATGAAADDGGAGIFNNGGTLLVSNTRIISNMATGASGSGGGVFSTAGAVTINNSVIDSNSANRAGGGIEAIDGTLNFKNTIISYNDVNGTAGTASPGNGGALHVTGAVTTTVDSCQVMFNKAAAEGGGLWNSATGTMTVQNSTTLRGNIALGVAADNGGGALFNNGGTMTVNNTTMVKNKATGTSGSGGAILSVAGNVKINTSTMDSNSANRAGGAIEIIDGIMTITASAMTNNDVNGGAGTANPGNGGALHVTGMTGTNVTIEGGTISNNLAAREGGGLWNQSGSAMNVQNRTTIDGNIAAGAATDDGGGGIFNNGGVMAISAVTISNNMATGTAGTGGGILNISNGNVALSRTIISGNTANAGGGIHNNGKMVINSNTITNNTAATNGGGIAQMNMSDTVTILSSIVASNKATAGSGKDIYSAMNVAQSSGFNLVGQDDANDFGEVSTDIEGTATLAVDAKLDVLADNGGGAKTHALQKGSPAIDMGNPVDMSNDQRDSLVFNGRRDIGAFENRGNFGAVGNVVVSNVTTMFPNPAVNGVFQVNAPREMGVTSIKVIELATGKTVYNAAYVPGERVNLGSQASGNYLVQVLGTESVEIHKLVVAK